MRSPWAGVQFSGKDLDAPRTLLIQLLFRNCKEIDSGRVALGSLVRSIASSYPGRNEVWDHFTTSLPKAAVIHQWNTRSAIPAATAAGYNALNSAGWYLDCIPCTWEGMYANDPMQGVVSPAAQKLVLGGQGEMWGETVDASDIEETVWPRLAAIAEQLWSPKTVTAAPQALGSAIDRLKAFRCLLNRRGIRAAPALNANGREAPPGPGSCLNQ